MLHKNHVNHLMTSQSSRESSGNFCNDVHTDSSQLWIVDTRATDYVCHTLSMFQCHKRVRPVNVRLLDGSQITTSTAGTVYFSKDLVLTNVLFIPTFPLNLISVSRLISVVNCRLIFIDNGCHIQDNATLRMIGVARLDGGLYTFSPQKKFQLAFHTVNTFNSYKHNAWHLRLGHPSH